MLTENPKSRQTDPVFILLVLASALIVTLRATTSVANLSLLEQNTQGEENDESVLAQINFYTPIIVNMITTIITRLVALINLFMDVRAKKAIFGDSKLTWPQWLLLAATIQFLGFCSVIFGGVNNLPAVNKMQLEFAKQWHISDDPNKEAIFAISSMITLISALGFIAFTLRKTLNYANNFSNFMLHDFLKAFSKNGWMRRWQTGMIAIFIAFTLVPNFSNNFYPTQYAQGELFKNLNGPLRKFLLTLSLMSGCNGYLFSSIASVTDILHNGAKYTQQLYKSYSINPFMKFIGSFLLLVSVLDAFYNGYGNLGATGELERNDFHTHKRVEVRDYSMFFAVFYSLAYFAFNGLLGVLLTVSGLPDYMGWTNKEKPAPTTTPPSVNDEHTPLLPSANGGTTSNPGNSWGGLFHRVKAAVVAVGCCICPSPPSQCESLVYNKVP